MENINRVQMVVEEEINLVKKEMRKLRDRKLTSGDRFFSLIAELAKLERVWDVLR